MATPKIEDEKCTQCWTCVEVCPVQVYEKDEENNKVVIAKPEDCIACMVCQSSCPVEAIVVEE